jgi:CDP-diacylglycerol--glycerol-3-phosphate 3-phosphatidyltransferase/cardiolipin synthase
MASIEERGSAPRPQGFFSAEELLLPPNLMSALRLPLAAIFPFAARSQGKALAVLALAGLTDILDGWLARSDDQVTATGAVLDPIADKVFALSVVSTLIAQGKIPRWGVAALLAREILEAPLLCWVLVQAHVDGVDPRDGEVHANGPGKMATVAQFAAVMVALELPAVLPLALAAAAATGTAAGLAYWRRELARRRRSAGG